MRAGILVAAGILAFSAVSAAAYKIPCTIDGLPSGCEPRIKPCGTYTQANDNWGPGSGDKCAAGSVCKVDVNYAQHCADDRSGNNNIPPIRREWQYLVQFDLANSSCYEILMEAGECWMAHPKTSGDYNCIGRCGAGCGGAVCSNWSKKCLRHDVCSWFVGAAGGSSDANCGDEFDSAQDDYTAYCGWGFGWSGDRCELFDQNHKNLQDSNSCWEWPQA